MRHQTWIHSLFQGCTRPTSHRDDSQAPELKIPLRLIDPRVASINAIMWFHELCKKWVLPVMKRIPLSAIAIYTAEISHLRVWITGGIFPSTSHINLNRNLLTKLRTKVVTNNNCRTSEWSTLCLVANSLGGLSSRTPPLGKQAVGSKLCMSPSPIPQLRLSILS
jgi:hypothetical protein